MNKDYSNPFDEIRRWLKTANQQIMDHEYNSIIINLLLCLLVIVCTIVIVLGDIFFAVMRLFKALYYVVLKLSEKAKTMKKGFAWDTVIYCCLFTVALTALMYFGMRFIHQKAKETNQMVIKYKDTNYEDVFSYYETPNLKEYCPYTTGTNYDRLVDATFQNIFVAVFNNRRDFDVNSIAPYLSFPLDKYNQLTFKNMTDYLCFLHSIGLKDDVSRGEKELLGKEFGLVKGMMRVYRKNAINDFALGRFYSSNEYINSFFDLYIRKSSFPMNGDNNDMHILKLLLDFRDDLLENREFAEYALECVDNETYSCMPYFSSDNNNLELLNEYFDCVSLFENKSFLKAQEGFSNLCLKTSESSLLAQYCMHMAIRSAYWNYDAAMYSEDKLNREKAYATFCDVFEKYAILITLPYFVSDIIEYRIDVGF